jgi:murein L,D-transpeptidase YcbB/YkuD
MVGKKNGIHYKIIPVYIGYFTAWVDDKDEIHFEDIYKRDDELASLLFHQITIQNVNEW